MKANKMIKKHRVYAALFCIVAMILFCSGRGENAEETLNNNDDEFGHVIGIDFGYDYSVVSIKQDGVVEIIPNDEGNKMTPTYLRFTDSEVLIGETAKNDVAKNDGNTIYGFKKLIGKDFNDKSIQRDIKAWPFKVVNQDNKPFVQVNYQGEETLFSPEQLSAMVLGKMKSASENYLGQKVEHVVIAVPADFNDRQRQAMKHAAKLADLELVRIVNEPTSATIAYGLNKNEDDTNVIVVDLNDETLDVSLVSVDMGVCDVLSTSGNLHFGGKNFDARVLDVFIKMVWKKYGIDLNLSEHDKALAKLHREVSKATRVLSKAEQVEIEVEGLTDGVDFSETLTRSQFELLNDDLFQKVLKSIRRVLKDAQMSKWEINEIVVTGEMTSIPKLREMISSFFHGKEINRGLNPKQTIAYGAAVVAEEFEMLTAGDSDSDTLVLTDPTWGFSVGGAMDINNFRQNIIHGFLPRKSDVTIEGIFYDYYFDTGLSNDLSTRTISCNALFCPSYSQGISNNPRIRNETDHFLSIGLNSNMEKSVSDFRRNKLNLVVVLDVSGSMDSFFSWYYDQHEDSSDEEQRRQISKIEVAKKSLVKLLDHLGSEDRFSLVLFDDDATVDQPLQTMSSYDVDALKRHIIDDVHSKGGTNFEAGYRAATKILQYVNSDNEYDNRIIFLTDAMPNVGEIGEDDLLEMTQNNADNMENRIYSTFIGIGVDFNTRLIDYITKIRGANYYSVHNSEDFATRMDDEFEYMVSPLVFDLKLLFDSDSMKINAVYGSNSNAEGGIDANEIMSVSTLFPSARKDNQTKGGIILAKLETKDTDSSTNQDLDHTAKIILSYEDAGGTQSINEQIIDFDSVLQLSEQAGNNYFENSGIRKGVLLTRYVKLLHDWIDHQNSVTPHEDYRWLRQSLVLTISDEYKKKLEEFRDYFIEEMKAIGDETLEQEVKLMNLILDGEARIQSKDKLKMALVWAIYKLEDSQISEQMSQDEIDAMKQAYDDMSKWLEQNNEARKHTFHEKQLEFESAIEPMLNIQIDDEKTQRDEYQSSTSLNKN